MRCVTACLAHAIDLSKLELYVKNKQFKFTKYWKCLQIEDPNNRALCHVFANGSIVVWTLKKGDEKSYIQFINPFLNSPLKQPILENYSYVLGKKTFIKPHDYFNVEIITLMENEPELKLSLAYGLAQSIKLRYYETLLEQLIDTYSPFIQAIAGKTKRTITRPEVQQIIANILHTKSQINLTTEFLYVPKFFWQYPNLETNYIMLENYLDLSDRIDALNQQLDTLNETFSIFNDYLVSKHSHFLEFAILVLIAVDIVIAFFNVHW